MTLEMYSIKDELNGYSTPIPFMDEKLAKRYFKDQMLGNPTMNNSPEDFSLHRLGDFNTETGIYANYEELTLIEKGASYANS